MGNASRKLDIKLLLQSEKKQAHIITVPPTYLTVDFFPPTYLTFVSAKYVFTFVMVGQIIGP